MLLDNVSCSIAKYYTNNEIEQLKEYILANRNFVKKQKLASINIKLGNLKSLR